MGFPLLSKLILLRRHRFDPQFRLPGYITWQAAAHPEDVWQNNEATLAYHYQYDPSMSVPTIGCIAYDDEWHSSARTFLITQAAQYLTDCSRRRERGLVFLWRSVTAGSFRIEVRSDVVAELVVGIRGYGTCEPSACSVKDRVRQGFSSVDSTKDEFSLIRTSRYGSSAVCGFHVNS